MDVSLAALVSALQSDNSACRLDAAHRLCLMGEEARPAAAALVRACGDEDEQVLQWASAALEELGPPLPADLPALSELLHDNSLDVAHWAAMLLGRLGSEARASVPALAAVLHSQRPSVVRQRAAWALGEIGVAAGATAALEEAAAATDPRLARLAREALERVR